MPPHLIKNMGTDAHNRGNKGSVDIYKEQPPARAAPIIDTAAKKYGVAPTALSQILVWAWGAAGPIEPTTEPQSVITARKTHRDLAYRTRAFTQPLANAFLAAAGSAT